MTSYQQMTDTMSKSGANATVEETTGLMLPTYAQKPSTYFSGARMDFVRLLPENPAAQILEIGCGDGSTGAAVIAAKKCAKYVGVEIYAPAAEIAGGRLTSVLLGDVETLELPWPKENFDALILSEVLEHLVNPWRVLRRLHPFMKEGALVLASSPNVSQYKVILDLLKGKWTLADSGVMDRTHLRWFTPQSYREMFVQTGFDVIGITSLVPFSNKVRLLNWLSAGYFEHMFMRQINLVGRKTP
jgi:2-polyprenyl-3-methyl-5-hydroxy-6-metoxy-1,4-benzoquinol methylase